MKRELRNQLEELSIKTYGAKNAWRKVVKLQGYQIPVKAEVPRQPKTEYVRKGGTLYKESTAVEKFGMTPREKQEPRPVIKYREPNTAELLFMMDRAYKDSIVALVLSKPEQPHYPTFVLAYLHKHERLSWDVRLKVSQDTEDYHNSVKENLAKIDEVYSKKINSWIIKDSDENKDDTIDLEEYLNEFVNLNDESTVEFDRIFNEAEAKHQQGRSA